MSPRNSQASPKNDSNHKLSSDGSLPLDWYDKLNMGFVTKVFKPDSPFFSNLGKIWELEANLEEIISLLVPEAKKTKNLLIQDYAEKSVKLCSNLKSLISHCIEEVEDTRKEMFKVAKMMMKYKEKLNETRLQASSLHAFNKEFENQKGTPSRKDSH